LDSHITDIDSLKKTKLSTPTFWNSLFCVAPVYKEDNADYFVDSIDGSGTDGKQVVLYTDDGRSDSDDSSDDDDSDENEDNGEEDEGEEEEESDDETDQSEVGSEDAITNEESREDDEL
jgi:hypothetical protein